jgi:hypothetical protein
MEEAKQTYQIGQSVRVVPGVRNNTPRRATIRMGIWHHKDSCWDYYIRVCGKSVSKRYRDEDLVPDTIDSSWLTSDVIALAEGIRAAEAFDRMPILADAIQDAGCDNEDVLNHCRGEGVHVRGCWVIDLVLGKE